MTIPSGPNWKKANKEYLLASIKLVKEELEYYSRQSKRQVGEAFQPSNEATIIFQEIQNQLSAPAAIDVLTNMFGLSSFERKILLICAGVELQNDVSVLVAKVQGGTELVQPSFNLAMSAFSGAHWSAISPDSPLRKWDLIKFKNGSLIAKSRLQIDEPILHYLTGFKYLDERLRQIIKLAENPIPLAASQQNAVNRITRACASKKQEGGVPIVLMEGEEDGDQELIAAALAQKMEKKLHRISIHSIPIQTTEITRLAQLWNREAKLNAGMLYLDSRGLNENDPVRVQTIINFIEAITELLIMDKRNWTSRLVRQSIVLKACKPTRSEQTVIWEKSLGALAKDCKKQIEKITSHFNLSTKAISAIGNEVCMLVSMPKKKTIDYYIDLKNTLWGTCCKYTRPKVDELVQFIPPIATWKDIVLPEPQTETLREIAMQVKNRRKVYDDWGFATKSSRGFGISALFAGESGTGKTMAAEVLANELELDLYRIDLSQVVNKYIGETEKNLKRIFDAAEAGSAILLFDEADALFGKRSEVKDSHDRYSNIEVSYLLQRMESYQGLAILTTNMKSSIDQAFLRRIRFVLNFERPKAPLREAIWRKVFPAQAAVGKLDYSKLSRINLSGGNISNIAMNAAFLAAGENAEVDMSHLLKATQSEYQKLERTLSRTEIKDWP